jgi:hypothetical protein
VVCGGYTDQHPRTVKTEDTMIIHVKSKHIKAGEKFDCQECPIALAIYDATGDSYVAVTYNDIKVGPVNKYKLPRSCKRFMETFDSEKLDGRKRVKSFRFRLVPQCS